MMRCEYGARGEHAVFYNIRPLLIMTVIYLHELFEKERKGVPNFSPPNPPPSAPGRRRVWIRCPFLRGESLLSFLETW